MPFNIPAISDMVQRARDSFRSELKGSDASLWPNNVYVSAKVIGGAVWEIFGRLKRIDLMRFAYTSPEEGLVMHGIEYNVPRKAASYAFGLLDVPGTITVAHVPFAVPKGTVFLRADGVQFETAQDWETPAFSSAIGAITLTVQVQALQPGLIGNTVSGIPFTTTLTGVTNGVATVNAAGIASGADLEPLEEWRQRILDRKRLVPMGGADYDWIAWAKSQPGVTRVFVTGNAFGPGTVSIYFMMDDTYPDGIPLTADITAMQDFLNTVKPVTSFPIVLPPVPNFVDVTIQGLSPDNPTVRAAVVAELASMFKRMTQPGTPGSPFTLWRSLLWQAVSNAAGDQHHNVQFPTSDIQFSTGFLPVLRNVNFVT